MFGKLVVVAGADVRLRLCAGADVPAICDALGINVLSVRAACPGCNGGSDPAAAGNSQVDTQSRTVTIEFDANARGPWDFKPAQRSVQVHPGELTTVMYEFRNAQNRTMAAQAIPSYAPRQAMAHFNKLECFCFNEYTLAPGEAKQWPVVFVIDPKLPKDVTARSPVVHLLRGGRQGAGRRRTTAAIVSRPGAGGEGARRARGPRSARARFRPDAAGRGLVVLRRAQGRSTTRSDVATPESRCTSSLPACWAPSSSLALLVRPGRTGSMGSGVAT